MLMPPFVLLRSVACMVYDSHFADIITYFPMHWQICVDFKIMHIRLATVVVLHCTNYVRRPSDDECG